MCGHGLDRACSGYGQVAGTCECGNEPSGSIKFGEFLYYLKTGYLLKNDAAPWISMFWPIRLDTFVVSHR